MRRVMFFLLFIAVMGLQIVFTGCNSTTSPTTATVDPTASKVKSDQAYQLVETEMMTVINGNFTTAAQYDQLKFSSALSLYNEAITLNPDNTDAQFGAAVTEMLAAYSDPDINTLVKNLDSAQNSNSTVVKNLISTTLLPTSTSSIKLSTAPAAAAVAFSIKTALKDPPLISKMQSVLSANFLPKVQRAIDHLALIDGNEAFKFTISGKMQGDASLQPVTVYPTEVALLSGMMNFLKFNIETMLIYQFPLTDYNQATLLSALNQNNTTFFVLGTDGKQHATNAKTAFNTSITKIQKAIDYLKRISGSKSDAIIKLGANGIKSSDLDTVSTYLNKVLTSLSSDVSTTINNADSDGNSYTIKVNLGTLFSNPPQNPKKDILPAYTVSAKGTDGVNIKFNAQTYADFTFPDPTMGGLFPGMAQETLKRLLRIDENYQFELNGWVQLHPYSYNSVNPLNGALFTIVANGVTYQTPLDQWGSYDLIIRNVSSVAQPITKISLILNGTEYELQNISPNAFAGVQAKVYAYCPVSFVLPPKNLAAAKQTSPQGVFLSWNTNPSYIINYWNDGYVVQRKTGSTGYADISINSNYSNLSGVDYNITTGTQYYYRIRAFNATELSSYMYGDLYCVPKSVYYSNEVSFTP